LPGRLFPGPRGSRAGPRSFVLRVSRAPFHGAPRRVSVALCTRPPTRPTDTLLWAPPAPKPRVPAPAGSTGCWGRRRCFRLVPLLPPRWHPGRSANSWHHPVVARGVAPTWAVGYLPVVKRARVTRQSHRGRLVVVFRGICLTPCATGSSPFSSRTTGTSRERSAKWSPFGVGAWYSHALRPRRHRCGSLAGGAPRWPGRWRLRFTHRRAPMPARRPRAGPQCICSGALRGVALCAVRGPARRSNPHAADSFSPDSHSATPPHPRPARCTPQHSRSTTHARLQRSAAGASPGPAPPCTLARAGLTVPALAAALPAAAPMAIPISPPFRRPASRAP